MPRRVPDPWVQQALTFLTFRAEADRARLLKEGARDWLKPWLVEHGEERDPDRGHKSMDFPEPVLVNGVTYIGLTARQNITKELVVDAATDLLVAKGLVNRVRKLRPAEYYMDWGELDVLVQEGKITEDEYDSLIEDNVTWALWPNEE